VLGLVRDRGLRADVVFLLEADGSPADGAGNGGVALAYSDYLTDSGLAELAGTVEGISVNKRLILRLDAAGAAVGVTDLVDRAHAVGLSVFCWTLRAENLFLARNFKRGASRGAFGDWMSEFQLILRSGVDGVFADQPDLALRARAAL
jgi:glycerophosphoryl diester phosphodiesterase